MSWALCVVLIGALSFGTAAAIQASKVPQCQELSDQYVAAISSPPIAAPIPREVVADGRTVQQQLDSVRSYNESMQQMAVEAATRANRIPSVENRLEAETSLRAWQEATDETAIIDVGGSFQRLVRWSSGQTSPDELKPRLDRAAAAWQAYSHVCQ